MISYILRNTKSTSLYGGNHVVCSFLRKHPFFRHNQNVCRLHSQRASPHSIHTLWGCVEKSQVAFFIKHWINEIISVFLNQFKARCGWTFEIWGVAKTDNSSFHQHGPWNSAFHRYLQEVSAELITENSKKQKTGRKREKKTSTYTHTHTHTPVSYTHLTLPTRSLV